MTAGQMLRRMRLGLRLGVLDLILLVGQGLLGIAVRMVIKCVRCARVSLVVWMLMWMLRSRIFNRAMRLVRRLEERHGSVIAACLEENSMLCRPSWTRRTDQSEPGLGKAGEDEHVSSASGADAL